MVFLLNLKNLHVKIANLLWVVVQTNNSMICTFLLLLQVKHTEKKQKLHRINKVIKRKNNKKKKQIANLHTYMAIYLQILKYVTAVLIPYYCT